MKHLPAEVLSNIFTFASHSSDDLHDTMNQTIVLSHVCQQWRRGSILTSSLWTTIYLFFPLTCSQLARTATWLLRSRNRPLYICMDFRDPSWDWNETGHKFGWKDMENLVRLLLPHAHRWRDVELYTDTWAPIFTFLSYTASITSVPNLRSIQLSRCNAYFSRKGESFRPASMATPIAWFGGGLGFRDLTKVSLSGVHINWVKSGLCGLREVELKYHAREMMPSVEEFLAIIDACPQLACLTILGWGPRIDPTSKILSPIVRLDVLEELRVGFVDVDNAIDFMSIISAPNLRSISIEDVGATLDPSGAQDFSRLFEYLGSVNDGVSSPRLPLSCIHTLSLRAISVSDISVRHFVSQLHSIKALHLSDLEDPSMKAFWTGISACTTLTTLTLTNIDFAVLFDVLAPSPELCIPGLRIFVDFPFYDTEDSDADA